MIHVPTNHATIAVASLRPVEAATSIVAIGVSIGSIIPPIAKAVWRGAVLAGAELQALIDVVTDEVTQRSVLSPPVVSGGIS